MRGLGVSSGIVNGYVVKKVIAEIMNLPTAKEIENYLQNKIKLM